MKKGKIELQRNAFEHYSIEELYDMTDIDIEEIDRDTEYKNETGFLNTKKQNRWRKPSILLQKYDKNSTVPSAFLPNLKSLPQTKARIL